MRGRRKDSKLKLEDKKVKQVITGAAIPKSLGLIELEKNYALLARMMTGIIERIHRMENEMEKLESKVGRLLRSKRLTL